MKKQNLLFFLLVMAFNLLAQSNFPLGINLSSISPRSTSVLFKDVKKQSGEWLAFDMADGQFAPNIVVPVRADGYPQKAPFDFNGNSYAPFCLILNHQPEQWLYPTGDYTLIFEGAGMVEVNDVSFTTAGIPHTIPIDTATSLGIVVSILQSDTTNPVRNIQLIMPGYENTYQQQPFHPRFLEVIDPFPVLRFMKPTAVEENATADWSSRTHEDYHTYYSDERAQVRTGLPYEWVIRLANHTRKDPWICIPFAANDDYITKLAQLFSDSLNSGINLYLEYSNETWNTDYPETRNHVNSNGLALLLDSDTIRAGQKYHTLRSLEIFEIFRTVFGTEQNRLIEVIATQPWDAMGRLIVDALHNDTINPNNIMPDAIAVAPYIGSAVINHLVGQSQQCNVSVDDVLDSLEQNYAQWMEGMVRPFRQWADSMNIDLFAYEGGQYMTFSSFEPNDSCSTELIMAANRHDRMEDIYCHYYDYWFKTLGGDLFMTFNLTERYGEFGATGLLESMWQDASTAPKWRAQNQCVFVTAPVTISDEKKMHSIQPYPNPFSNTTNFTIDLFSQIGGNIEIEVYDLLGKKVKTDQVKAMKHELNREGLLVGVYIYQIKVSHELLGSGKLVVQARE